MTAGSTWACAADNDTNSGGTVTGVTAGTGLAGGGTSGNVTLSNTGVLGVVAGSGISISGSSGNFTITNIGDINTADDITTLTAGTGISITGSGNSRTVANTGVTAVTASAPLSSTGGTTPNISLPNVIIAVTNTAIGTSAFNVTSTGISNTASGQGALRSNFTGNNNTGIGAGADVFFGDLTGATAIGANAEANASNTVRLGDANVTVIEGQVAFTASSDRTKKENFKPVNEDEVLKKIGQIPVQSWNYIGHDPKQFRHYGPMAQDFFAAFGKDGVGTIGTPTTINSGDMAGILMIAAQALEKQNRDLKARVDELERLVKDRPYLTVFSEPVP